MNTMESSELQSLLQDLKCRASVEQIPDSSKNTILEFLRLEQLARSHHKIHRLMVSSGISKHQMRTFEQFDWDFNTSAPKQDILAFRNSSWTEQASNLVMIGDPGIGKSHIAKALCFDAIKAGLTTYFTSAFDLISKIKLAPYPSNKIEFFGKTLKVLCIDELGYTFHQKDDSDLLFQIISKRSEILPTIVTSNLPPKQWGTIFSGSAASAILDRLSSHGKFLTWDGKSYRANLNKKRK